MQYFRDGVHERHTPIDIRGDDRIADALQGRRPGRLRFFSLESGRALSFESLERSSLSRLTARDVEGDPEPFAGGASVIEQRECPYRHPDVQAIRAAKPKLRFEDPPFGLRCRPFLGGCRTVLGVNRFPTKKPSPFLFGLARKLAPTW